MEPQQVIVYSADVAAFVDALETIGIGYPVVEAQGDVINGEEVEVLTDDNIETYTIENPEIIEQLADEEEQPRPAKRFRTNPKQQKEIIEKLFEKQKAVVTEKGFMNAKGNKRFKSDVWSWFGDIKLLISRSEAMKLKIPFYFRQCGDEKMMLSQIFVGCFRCSALFIHNAQRSGTSTLRAHMRVCSRPKPRKKKGAPTIIFFSNKPNKQILKRVINEDDKTSAYEQMMNFILSTESSFDIIEDPEFQKLLQMCISIGATYGDVNVDSMLCPQEKLSDFLLNDLYISSVNAFYTEFQYAFGATFKTDIWTDEQRQGYYISVVCHYAASDGELKSVVLHTDDFSCEQKTAEDAYNWFLLFISDMPVLPVKRLLLVDNVSNTPIAFKSEECIKCAYQNLVLALNSVIGKLVLTTHTDYTDFVSLVCDCKDIVSYFDQKGFQYQLSEPLKVCRDESWSSFGTMFRLIHSQFEDILRILNETGETHILSVDKSILTAVIDFFQPFDTALIELRNDNEPTLNHVIPWITKFKRHCISSHTDYAIIQQMKTHLDAEINERLTKNVTVYHRIATTLDPRFRHLGYLPREDLNAANNKLKSLMKECAEASAGEDLSGMRRPPTDGSSPKDRFADLYSSNVSYEAGTGEKSANREIDAYLSESCNQNADQRIKFNPLKFWFQRREKYPNLSRVALWILSCPASCVRTEELFYVNDWLVHCCRVRQKPDYMNKILFVNSVRKLGKIL